MQEINENEEVKRLIDLNNLPVPRLDGHQWRQYGNQLICQSCPNEHSQFLPVDVYFAGIDTHGNPIIKKRWER